MSRLHTHIAQGYAALRKQFTTPALILSIAALVLALAGGAYAAGGGLSGKQKKEVEKIAKKFAGQPGTNGTNGTNGAPGEKGAPGAPGESGKAGEGVTNTPIKVGEAECSKLGGAKFTVGSGKPTTACNGKNGETGFTETLPAGKTETGLWGVRQSVLKSNEDMISHSSFNIPLAEAPENVHLIGPEEGAGEPHANLPEGCSGNVSNPGAAEGNLCIFAEFEHDVTSINICSLQPIECGNHAGTAGFFVYVQAPNVGPTQEEGPESGVVIKEEEGGKVVSEKTVTLERHHFHENPTEDALFEGSWAVTAK